MQNYLFNQSSITECYFNSDFLPIIVNSAVINALIDKSFWTNFLFKGAIPQSGMRSYSVHIFFLKIHMHCYIVPQKD